MIGLEKISVPTFYDPRGSTFEMARTEQLRESGFELHQVTVSKSVKGTFRGLHFPVKGVLQEKVVFCLDGEILDVVVNMDKTSSEYLTWEVVSLASSDEVALRIGPSLAHGFLAKESSTVVYLSTTTYDPMKEDQISVHSLPRLVKELEQVSGLSSDQWIFGARDQQARVISGELL